LTELAPRLIKAWRPPRSAAGRTRPPIASRDVPPRGATRHAHDGLVDG
jgi:hypothetical protein